MKTSGSTMIDASGATRRSYAPSGRGAAQHIGLFAGTKIACNLGWRSVEKLCAGDKVLTFDNGMQEVREVRRVTVFAEAPGTTAELWPLCLPAGALGNRDRVVLPAHQPVMLECDAVRDRMGDPFAVVPARALDGYYGITRRAPKTKVNLISVVFAEDEVVYIDSGMLVFCPRHGRASPPAVNGADVPYSVLSLKQSLAVLKRMDFSAQRIVQTRGYVIGATGIGLVA